MPFADVDGLALAVDRLMGDPPFAERLGRQGREKAAAHYSWDVVAERVREQYRAVLDEGTASDPI